MLITADPEWAGEVEAEDEVINWTAAEVTGRLRAVNMAMVKHQWIVQLEGEYIGMRLLPE